MWAGPLPTWSQGPVPLGEGTLCFALGIQGCGQPEWPSSVSSLHPQEAMLMVPRFCFPFDVLRYGRKQVSGDPGSQTLRASRIQTPRDPGIQALRDPDNQGPKYPGPETGGHSTRGILGSMGEVRELGTLGL